MSVENWAAKIKIERQKFYVRKTVGKTLLMGGWMAVLWHARPVADEYKNELTIAEDRMSFWLFSSLPCCLDEFWVSPPCRGGTSEGEESSFGPP